MIKMAKGFELKKIIFITNLNTFGSKLTQKNLDFQNVASTNLIVNLDTLNI
jgi:hypothetical protein